MYMDIWALENLSKFCEILGYTLNMVACQLHHLYKKKKQASTPMENVHS